MRRTGILGLAVLVALLAAAPAVAQNTLTAYVVHGIPGNDFDLDPTLPVDFSVSGLGCALTGFEFGNRVGPLTIPAGTYDITIRLANASEPCTGTTVIALRRWRSRPASTPRSSRTAPPTDQREPATRSASA